MSIGKFAVAMIRNNPTMKNDDVLAAVKKQFPEAKTTYACIAWYKSDLRKKGLLTPRLARTAEQIKAEIEKLEEQLLKLMEELEVLEPSEQKLNDNSDEKQEEQQSEKQEEEKV